MPFSPDRLNSLLAGFDHRRVAVLGDLMLDRYIWGTVTRVSPEAPVPVVEVTSESSRLGGAANVANNILSLGGRPVLLGVVGADRLGDELIATAQDCGLDPGGIVRDDARPTTVKTRVIAHGQHVVRIDQEARHDISGAVEDALIGQLERLAPTLDGLILEDYNKGVLTPGVIERSIAIAKRHGVRVTVDPKYHHFLAYRGVAVFKPNRKETEDALGYKLGDDAAVERAGRQLVDLLGAEHVLITRSEHGMTLIPATGDVVHVPTHAREVADVSGAGDTVISTLTMALVSGATATEATVLANCAGGIVCGEVGIVPITRDQLHRFVTEELLSA